MDFSSFFKSTAALVPRPLKTLWDEGTFGSLFLALPTVLTSGLFITFGLLDVFLACLKWIFFSIIIVVTFLLGLLLMVVSAVLLVGLVVGLIMGAVEKGDVKVLLWPGLEMGEIC